MHKGARNKTAKVRCHCLPQPKCLPMLLATYYICNEGALNSKTGTSLTKSPSRFSRRPNSDCNFDWGTFTNVYVGRDASLLLVFLYQEHTMDQHEIDTMVNHISSVWKAMLKPSAAAQSFLRELRSNSDLVRSYEQPHLLVKNPSFFFLCFLLYSSFLMHASGTSIKCDPTSRIVRKGRMQMY